MAKYHVALYRLSQSSNGAFPVPDMAPVSSEIIDTAVSKVSTIYPLEDNLFWDITTLSTTGGWVKLGAKGTATSAPLPVPAVNTGNPVLGGSGKAWKAPKFCRIGIEPMV